MSMEAVNNFPLHLMIRHSRLKTILVERNKYTSWCLFLNFCDRCLQNIFQAANVTSTTKGDGASRLVEILKDNSYPIAMKSCS